MERMIEFLKILDRQIAKSIPTEYIALSIGASRDGFVELNAEGDDITATLTEKGAAFIKTKSDYPTLVENVNNGVIVLASASTCGTVLVSNEPTMPIGLFRMDWPDFSDTTIWERLKVGDVVNLTQI